MTLLNEYYEHRESLTQDPAKRILFALVNDFTDRRGFRQTWEGIDSDIQEEILSTWLEIINHETFFDPTLFVRR